MLDDSSKGSAYIFVRSGSLWTQQAKLQLSDAVANDYFGSSVAISSDGNTAVIGAYGRATYGYAYVYTRSGTVWTKEANLTPADRTTVLKLGTSVSISANGNTVAVGAPNTAGGGKVIVFNRASGVWTIPATGTLSSSTPGTSGMFGQSVSLSALGDILLIGAYGDPVNGTNSGSAYTFILSSSGWKECMHLLPFDNGSGDAFGSAVAISGSGAVGMISSKADDDRGTDAGSAYIYN